jgi:hypothetical protein
MSSLPSPPPSPLDRRRHRRSDSFALLQAIIKEREKEEHQQEEIQLKSKLLRFSCPAPTKKTVMMDNKEIVIPHKSLSHHSVRFTTEPPKVYHYTV